MAKLLSFPVLPPSSPDEPSVPLPAALVDTYRKMLQVLWFYSGEILDELSPCQQVRHALMLQRYNSLLTLGAIKAEQHRAIAATESRQALIRAMRAMDPKAIAAAIRECAAADGLSEIDEAWYWLCRSFCG